MHNRRLRSLACLAAVGLLAAACGDDDASGDADTTQAGGTSVGADTTQVGGTTVGADTTQVGDTTVGADTTQGGDNAGGATCEETVAGSQINYGVYAPANALDPTRVSGALVGGTEVAAIYDVLFRFDHETEEYVPHLAESLEPNDDYTEWTLTLREGITYSDGTPLDAQMVSDHIDRFFDEGVRNTSAGFLTSISEKTVVDETTLVVTLDTPWVEFPFVFADEPGMVVNRNAIGDDVDEFGSMPPDAAGVGPYVVERNAPGEELILVARDDYWGGPVCVERLRFVFTPGSTYEAFQAGGLDVGFLRTPQEIGQARDNNENEFMVSQDGGSVLIVNQREGRPGADPRVREAIALATDVSIINDRAYEGLLETSKAVIAPSSRFFSDAIVEAETDPDAARALLDEAKADGYDGSLQILCSTTPPAPEVALALEGLLGAVGFDVTVDTLATTDQIGEVVQSNFDTACWGFNAGPGTGISTFGRNFRSGSASNRMGYESDEMDASLDAILGAERGDDQLAAFGEMNRIFVDDNVAVNIGATEEGIVWSSDVSGIVPTVATIFLFHDAVVG